MCTLKLRYPFVWVVSIPSEFSILSLLLSFQSRQVHDTPILHSEFCNPSIYLPLPNLLYFLPARASKNSQAVCFERLDYQ